MNTIFVLNSKFFENVDNFVEYGTIPNKDNLKLQFFRKGLMHATKHFHPTRGKLYDVIKDMDAFVETYRAKLTDFECQEVSTYKRIYYFGENAPFKHLHPNTNHLTTTVFDHIDYRYEIWNVIGIGSFSIVLECFDHLQKQFVAIKVLNTNGDYMYYANNEILANLIIRENSEDNYKLKELFVKCIRIFKYRGFVHIVYEKMQCDILKVLRNTEGFYLSEDVIKHFAVTLIEGLIELDKLHLVHLDLKPNNLLLAKNKLQLKISDFSLCRLLPEATQRDASGQMLYFRAPEAILNGPITSAIDMWSVGCILVELHTAHTFLKGENPSHQIVRILEVLGLPPKQFLSVCKGADTYFHPNGLPKYCTSLDESGQLNVTPKSSPSGKPYGMPGCRPLTRILKNSTQYSIDFLSKCLSWDPYSRMLPIEALQHPYLKKWCPHTPLPSPKNKESKSVYPEMPYFVPRGLLTPQFKSKDDDEINTTERHKIAYLTASF